METPVAGGKTKPYQLNDLFGKTYVLDHSENYDEFLRELGVRKNVRTKALNSKPTVVLTRENDEYILTTAYPEGRRVRLKFKTGEEINRRRTKSHATRSVFTVEGNKLIEEQWVDEKVVLIERQFKKRDLLVTMEVNNVKCFRMYALVGDSMHSIQTETSRRSSLWDEKILKETEMSEVETGKKSSETSEDEIEENLCY